MKHTDLQKAIDKIVNDRSMTLDERIEAVTDLDPDGDTGGEGEIAIYGSLIKMVKSECEDHSQDVNLLHLYALLAEAYDEVYDYRPMKKVADGVIDLLREGTVSTEDLEYTIPRVIDALTNTVYHHALYEILLMYVTRVLKDDPYAKSVKQYAQQLLSLKVLIEYDQWTDRAWTKDLENALARLFTAEELVDIIAHPGTGHLKCDPVEYTRKWERIYYEVEEELDRRFKGEQRHMGLCFRIWSEKKDILKKKYGIDWRSPGEMNPRVIFD